MELTCKTMSIELILIFLESKYCYWM